MEATKLNAWWSRTELQREHSALLWPSLLRRPPSCRLNGRQGTLRRPCRLAHAPLLHLLERKRSLATRLLARRHEQALQLVQLICHEVVPIAARASREVARASGRGLSAEPGKAMRHNKRLAPQHWKEGKRTAIFPLYRFVAAMGRGGNARVWTGGDARARGDGGAWGWREAQSERGFAA